MTAKCMFVGHQPLINRGVGHDPFRQQLVAEAVFVGSRHGSRGAGGSGLRSARNGAQRHQQQRSQRAADQQRAEDPDLEPLHPSVRPVVRPLGQVLGFQQQHRRQHRPHQHRRPPRALCRRGGRQGRPRPDPDDRAAGDLPVRAQPGRRRRHHQLRREQAGHAGHRQQQDRQGQRHLARLAELLHRSAADDAQGHPAAGRRGPRLHQGLGGRPARRQEDEGDRQTGRHRHLPLQRFQPHAAQHHVVVRSQRGRLGRQDGDRRHVPDAGLPDLYAGVLPHGSLRGSLRLAGRV